MNCAATIKSTSLSRPSNHKSCQTHLGLEKQLPYRMSLPKIDFEDVIKLTKNVVITNFMVID